MADKPITILLTNDDGYQAPGIIALYKALSPLGKITVVAPEAERSASGHGLTIHQPLRLDSREHLPNVDIYSCNGTPTDCVTLALRFLLKEMPDILVSGINAGGNLGDDITYSGTVMAAMAGATQGVPSVGISLLTEKKNADYSFAAEFAAKFAKHLIGFDKPEEVFFSLNVPSIPREEIQGAMVTVQGRSSYRQRIVERHDPWGRSYYWLMGLRTTGKIEPGSDFYALEQKRISVTPLQISMTNEKFIEPMKNWDIFGNIENSIK